MPTYEYHCPECKATYDLQQSFSAETTHTCEECGKGTAKRVLHAPRVVFKGSGFYATDKGRGRVVDSPSSSSSDSSDSDSGSGSDSTESKPSKKASSTSTDSGSSPEAAAAG